MIDFMNTDKAKGIIDQYLTKGVYTAPPDINPVYDVREPGQEFPPLNPPINVTPDIDDPCPPGYQLIDGVCQPISDFGGTSVVEEVSGGDDDDDMEERPYMSIEDMKAASDEDLINYLTSGFLTNSGMLGFLPSKGDIVTLKDSIMPPAFKLGFGKQDEMRRKFIEEELIRRGFGIGTNEDGQQQFNINPILFKENLDKAVSNLTYRQDNRDDIVPVVGDDGTFAGYQSVDRTGGDFYQQTKPTENLGSLLSDDGSRNQKNYEAALRENVRRTVLAPTQTITYRDPDTGRVDTATAPRSNYSSVLGGFTGGR